MSGWRIPLDVSMMRLGQAYSVLVYMDLKRLNDYDETEQADTIMHMWKNTIFSRIRMAVIHKALHWWSPFFYTIKQIWQGSPRDMNFK